MSADHEGQDNIPSLPQLRPLTRKRRHRQNTDNVTTLLPRLPTQLSFERENDSQSTSNVVPHSSVWSRRQENSKKTTWLQRKHKRTSSSLKHSGGKLTNPTSPRKDETSRADEDKSPTCDTITRFPVITVPRAMRQKTVFLNEVLSRLAILQDETFSKLEEKKEMFQVFINTKAYTKGKNVLLKHKFLLIKSKPGDGATSISMKILHDFSEEQVGMTPFCIAEVTDFDEAMGRNNSLIFIDDLFDLDSVSLEYKKEWIEKLQRLGPALQANNRNIFVIITMPDDAFEYLPASLLETKLFQSFMLDLSHENNSLSVEEKNSFLHRYVAPFCKLDNKQINDIIISTLPFGFPRCCEIFRDNSCYHKDPVRFFSDPQIFIQGVLERFQRVEPSRLAPLALVLLSNGKLSEKQLYSIIGKKNSVSWKMFEDHYDGLKCERKDVKHLFQRVNGTYLQFEKVTKQFIFTHPAMQRAVACLLGRIDLKPVIKTCNLSMLPHMRTGNSLCRSKDEILLEPRCFKALSMQISKCLLKRNQSVFELLSKLSVWKEMKFVEYYAQFLKGTNMEDTFLLQDESNKGIFEYAMSNHNIRVLENMMFIVDTTGQSKILLDQSCENNPLLATFLLNSRVTPNIETIQSGIKSKNIALLREILRCLGKNFDQFARTQSKLADDFTYDVTIADEACLSGDENIVATIVENFPKLVSSTKESSFLILLKAAITGGNRHVVNRMVDIGIDDKSTADTNQTRKNSVVFYIACKNGEAEVAKYFGNGDQSLFTSRDKNNYTPLHSVACGGTKELGEYLINGGADPYAVTTKQATALHLSCASGNLDITAFLIEKFPKLVEMEDNKKATPVHYATRGGSIDIITLLIDNRADIAKVTARKETVLHVSCFRGYLDIARLVVERCPELASAATTDGYTALHFACTTDDLDLVRYLVEDLHLDPLQMTHDGCDSIRLATGYGVREYLERICVSRGLNPKELEGFHIDSDDESVPNYVRNADLNTCC